MEPYQQRIIDEKNELDYKISKLGIFLEGKFFYILDSVKKSKLTEQKLIMDEYSRILGERIELELRLKSR